MLRGENYSASPKRITNQIWHSLSDTSCHASNPISLLWPNAIWSRLFFAPSFSPTFTSPLPVMRVIRLKWRRPRGAFYFDEFAWYTPYGWERKTFVNSTLLSYSYNPDLFENSDTGWSPSWAFESKLSLATTNPFPPFCEWESSLQETQLISIWMTSIYHANHVHEAIHRNIEYNQIVKYILQCINHHCMSICSMQTAI